MVLEGGGHDHLGPLLGPHLVLLLQGPGFLRGRLLDGRRGRGHGTGDGGRHRRARLHGRCAPGGGGEPGHRGEQAEEHLGATPMITLATAHPAKFPDAVKDACGVEPPLPPRMADLFERPERVTEVPNDLAALQALIRERRRA